MRRNVDTNVNVFFPPESKYQFLVSDVLTFSKNRNYSSWRTVLKCEPQLTADHRDWMRSACSCSFVSSRVVIASLESAPFLSSSLRVGSPRSLYFLRVPQEGFPATELASRRPGHCISTRTCIRGSASSSTGLSLHSTVPATVAYSSCSCVPNAQLRPVSSVTKYVQRGFMSFM